MGSLGDPKTWVPYENVKDCSQGFCTLYCPQWCYIVFPPPPPYRFPNEVSSSNFSTLVIVLIGVLAITFLIGSYYTIVSKYCWDFDWQRRRRGDVDSTEEFNETNQNPSNHEPRQVSTTGLDDVSIKSIKAFRYKKGDGLIEGTDCSVCLGEFREDERLRLLPKCSHAFHLSCIDTWLKSHSNCPLCRANVDSTSNFRLQSPRPAQQESLPDITSSPENLLENHTIVSPIDSETNGSNDEILSNDVVRKKDIIIEIRSDEGADPPIRRTTSMDLSCPNRLSIADILCISDDENPQTDNQQHDQVGVGSSSKQGTEEHSKSIYRSRVLHCVMSPVAMKRSSSSGRLLFSKHSRGGNIVIPM